MAKYSIVIPLFNKEKYCLDSVRSVLEQSYKDFELIIVDDGSTDNCLELVSRFVEGLSNVQILSQKNSGVSSARNRGAKIASGEFLAFLDADDLWHPQYLELMDTTIRKFPNRRWFGAHCDKFTGANPKFEKLSLNSIEFDEVDYFRACVTNKSMECIINSNSFIIRKDEFFHVGAYRENMALNEDYDLYHRLAKRNTIVWADLKITYYRRDAESQTTRQFRVVPMTDYLKFHLNDVESKDSFWEREFVLMLLINWIGSVLISGSQIDKREYNLKCNVIKAMRSVYYKKRLYLRVIPSLCLYYITPKLSKFYMEI